MRRRREKKPHGETQPVKGDLFRRGNGIYWSVIEVDSQSVLYEVNGMKGEFHTISLDQWRRLLRRGHLVRCPSSLVVSARM